MGWSHVVLSTVGRMPLFGEEADRRGALQAIARVVDSDLALFTVVDDHLHVVLQDLRTPVGRHTRGLRLALDALPGAVPLQATWVGEVESRSHAETLLGYTLGQSAKHRLPEHPARWSGSCLADFVGARALEGFDPTAISRLLPRFHIEDALRTVGLGRLRELTPPELRELGAAAIAAASRAAYAVVSGSDQDRANVAARRAAIAVQRDAGIPASESAFSLNITQRAANRLRASVPASAGDVLRRRLALDAATGAVSAGWGTVSARRSPGGTEVGR